MLAGEDAIYEEEVYVLEDAGGDLELLDNLEELLQKYNISESLIIQELNLNSSASQHEIYSPLAPFNKPEQLLISNDDITISGEETESAPNANQSTNI